MDFLFVGFPEKQDLIVIITDSKIFLTTSGVYMIKKMLVGKIHRAVITGCDLNYPGSITIDKILMDAAQIHAWEQVQVVNLNNGVRFETYAISGEAEKGEILLNGAASRLAIPGDKVIIMSFGWLTQEEILNLNPRIIHVDDNNKIV